MKTVYPFRKNEVSNGMKVRFSKPCPMLRPYVECYWSWESDGTDVKPAVFPTVIPNTDTEMIVYYGMPFQATCREGESFRLPRSHTAFLKDRAMDLSIPKEAEAGFVAVRFRAGCIRHFSRGMPGDWTEVFIPLTEIWGREAAELENRVADADGYEERVRITESFLLKQLAKRKKPDIRMDHAVAALRSHGGNLSLSQLARSLTMSEKHFQRLFKQSVGVTAKRFQRLAVLN